MVAPVVAAAGEVVDGTTAVGTTHPFDAPAGIVDGSLLVAVYTVEHSSSGTLLAAPTGWAKAPDSDGAFQAVGINGQAIYVNPPKRVVIAQFSAWPQAAAAPAIRGESAVVFDAIVTHLER